MKDLTFPPFAVNISLRSKPLPSFILRYDAAIPPFILRFPGRKRAVSLPGDTLCGTKVSKVSVSKVSFAI
ncbi:MAG: hypothetical protein PUD87_00040 [Prevotellaceae bacterium]|nr:hypothetical protein [Prevotellaceae bacterium]